MAKAVSFRAPRASGVEAEAGAQQAVAAAAGPRSAAYQAELAALTEAVAQKNPNVRQRVQDFCARHRVRQFLRNLIYGGIPIPCGYGRKNFHIHPIGSTPFILDKYDKKLHEILPRVREGKITLDEARRKAAWSFRVLAPFRNQHAMEIAREGEAKGVLVGFAYPKSGWRADNASEYDGDISLFSLRDCRPNLYSDYRHSWRDLASRISIDEQCRIVSIDEVEPERGYETLLLVLRFVGDMT